MDLDSEHAFDGAAPVTLQDMLDAREARAAMQREMLAEHRRPLVSFTLNIPGEYKSYRLADEAFREGAGEIRRRLMMRGWAILAHRERPLATGHEGYFAVAADVGAVKAAMVDLEETHPLGRLFDADVLGADGAPLRGVDRERKERPCLLCDRSVWECARDRRHPARELALAAARLLDGHLRPRFVERVARDALRAILYELLVTPKSGLVDRRNNGAHRDMTVFTFADSAAALAPYFRDLVRAGMEDGSAEADGGAIPETLRRIGLEAERAMFDATGGVNTHKGLLFSLGLLSAGMGILRARGQAAGVDSLCAVCAAMAGGTMAELDAGAPESRGRRLFASYGEPGVRGEAAAGFPNARLHCLPVLRRLLAAGYSPNDAGAVGLLHLLARVGDANILHRAGPGRLATIRGRVGERLRGEEDVGDLLKFARELDDDCIARNVSPGGSADLLAVSFMLYFLFEGGEAG